MLKRILTLSVVFMSIAFSANAESMFVVSEVLNGKYERADMQWSADMAITIEKQTAENEYLVTVRIFDGRGTKFSSPLKIEGGGKISFQLGRETRTFTLDGSRELYKGNWKQTFRGQEVSYRAGISVNPSVEIVSLD